MDGIMMIVIGALLGTLLSLPVWVWTAIAYRDMRRLEKELDEKGVLYPKMW